jgi:hypothetical protein
MNTVGAPYSGKPNVRSDEGALGTPTPIHDDGLSPCVEETPGIGSRVYRSGRGNQCSTLPISPNPGLDLGRGS